MEWIEILVATLLATSAMTLFSYIISAGFRELYKEPVLLAFLMTSFDFKLSTRQKVIFAWCLHYLIGLLFVVSFTSRFGWISNGIRFHGFRGLCLGPSLGSLGSRVGPSCSGCRRSIRP